LYFDQILIRTAPWGLFAFGAVYSAVRRFRRRGYDATLVPVLALAVCLAVMTIVPNKREHYMLPILPMWALFLAGFMDQAIPRARDAATAQAGGPTLEDDPAPAWAFDWPLKLALIFLVVAMGAAIAFWPSHARSGTAFGVLFLAVVGALAAYGVTAAWRRRTKRAVTVLFAVTSILAVGALPIVCRFYTHPCPLAPVIKIGHSIPPGLPVAEYGVKEPVLFLKLNRHVTFAADIDKAREFLQEPGRRYLITKPEHASALADLPGRTVSDVGIWVLEMNPYHPTRIVVLAVSP
jgi:peptidoglycan/LPS O-acetylase OafA/YrhL